MLRFTFRVRKSFVKHSKWSKEDEDEGGRRWTEEEKEEEEDRICMWPRQADRRTAGWTDRRRETVFGFKEPKWKVAV